MWSKREDVRSWSKWIKEEAVFGGTTTESFYSYTIRRWKGMKQSVWGGRMFTLSVGNRSNRTQRNILLEIKALSVTYAHEHSTKESMQYDALGPTRCTRTKIKSRNEAK
ncbi:hypothetical protein ACH5RR_005104 [Cinchona calisaya]|uniref:Uncharacterized protein n=1 Tax=Cinchona calisaya TaxID=153742 RepID=A0ABD3AK81_9GENT